MKTISVTTKKVTIIVGIVMAILILLVFNAKAAGSGDPKNDLRYKSEVVKVQEAAKGFCNPEALDFEEFRNKKVFKIFDENENLLYQSEVNTDKSIMDGKLVKYLHQSDLVVNLDHTSFYRFNK